MTERIEPSWDGVEKLLTALVRTRSKFPTASSARNWVSQYEPGRRLLVENDNGSRWVQVGDIRDCWATFERLGRIHRRDVLDPGRCSGLVMALFARVDGVVAEDVDGAEFLVLPRVESRNT